MSYRCRHFSIEELVDPVIFDARGDRAWELLRPEILLVADALVDRFGTAVINNWHWGGDTFTGQIFKESGLRRFRTKIGAEFSQHKYGAALDLKFKDAEGQDVYRWILDHPERFPGITAVEDIASTPSWLHVDCRNHNRHGIWVVKP